MAQCIFGHPIFGKPQVDEGVSQNWEGGPYISGFEGGLAGSRFCSFPFFFSLQYPNPSVPLFYIPVFPYIVAQALGTHRVGRTVALVLQTPQVSLQTPGLRFGD